MTIRTFEERMKTNVYSPEELQMVQNQLFFLHQATEQPFLRAMLERLTIRQGDILFNGAPN